MRIQSKSESLIINKSYKNPVLVMVCLVASTSLLTSLSLYPVFAQEEASSLVDFNSDIEQIRGHLDQAAANKETGNTTLAMAHTLHPIAEIYSSIEAQIAASDPNLNRSLSSSLNELSRMVDNSTIEEFRTKVIDLNGLLNDTVSNVIQSSQLNNSTFNLLVIANLLSVADNEYKEAIENGTIKEIVEYQDGQAFISRAQSVFNEISPTIPLERSAEVQEINEFFEDLNNSVQERTNPEVVSNSIRSIIHEISEITGISEEDISGTAGGGEPLAFISEIRSLLNQTLEAYENRNYDEADTLAVRAYLDNYEFIEAPLAEQNQTLMETTEVMLREELRQLTQNNVSLQEIQDHIDKINSNLDQAETLLSGTS
ncbi:MAG TPA: hypothetical protein VE130_10190 [Nitrososphaeraceae archaeon]|nr:hypothetical protein [Nitrososphaeraceae archaeon]